MGIKSLSLQMRPWCFPLLGGGAPKPAKLITADGGTELFHRPISASELMQIHPKHLVCCSDSFTIGQMIPPLQEHELLKPGQTYFLLPLPFFQSVLSFVSLSSSSFSLLHRPFNVLKTASGKLQIRISDEPLGDVAAPPPRKVCTTAALEKDYQLLVGRSKARKWKPQLETIAELEWVRRRREKHMVSIVSVLSQILSSGLR